MSTVAAFAVILAAAVVLVVLAAAADRRRQKRADEAAAEVDWLAWFDDLRRQGPPPPRQIVCHPDVLTRLLRTGPDGPVTRGVDPILGIPVITSTAMDPNRMFIFGSSTSDGAE